MISRSQIEELRDKWQTTELNVAREFIQHVLLSSLYRGQSRPITLAFKGGTALRILRRSPRFSEDLDFTGWGKAFHVGRTLQETMDQASKAGLEFRLTESNATSGGWFARMETAVHDWPVQVEWNISLREKRAGKTDTVLVNPSMWAAYSVAALPLEEAVTEKIEALLRRKMPRDFFDLYFILRERLGVRQVAPWKAELTRQVKALNAKTLERELKEFMPRNHWGTVKQLPKMLLQELERL